MASVTVSQFHLFGRTTRADRTTEGNKIAAWYREHNHNGHTLRETARTAICSCGAVLQVHSSEPQRVRGSISNACDTCGLATDSIAHVEHCRR